MENQHCDDSVHIEHIFVHINEQVSNKLAHSGSRLDSFSHGEPRSKVL